MEAECVSRPTTKMEKLDHMKEFHGCMDTYEISNGFNMFLSHLVCTYDTIKT